MNLGDRIHVVLVRPIYPRNIGMAARAMANMGVSRLILIAPQCELGEEAKQGATKAQQVLREAHTYVDLRQFYHSEGEGARIAFSGRPGKLRVPERFDLKLRALLQTRSPLLLDPDKPIYLFFGPEDDGLSDEEIRDAHHVCSLPTYGDFFSMNLSHAVMLGLCTLRSILEPETPENAIAASKATRATGQPETPRSEGELRKEKLKALRAPKFFPEKTIRNWLEALGFELDDRRVNAERILTRIMLENEPTHDELRVLEAILQQTIRKLRE